MADTPKSDKHAGKTPRADALSKRMEGRALAECSVEFFSLACELELELRHLAAEYADLKVYGRSAPSAATTREAKLEGALKHVLWIKDCGIDGDEGDGKGLRNYPAQERDSMYEIAKAALSGEPAPSSHERRSAAIVELAVRQAIIDWNRSHTRSPRTPLNIDAGEEVTLADAVLAALSATRRHE